MRNRLAYGCVAVLSVWLAGCAQKEEPPPKPVVEVKVAKAEVADVQLSVRAPATIFPKEQANISPRVTAPIRRLAARKGDRVTAGQILAELEKTDLIAQRDEAIAVVADAEANLQKVTSGTNPTDVERARGQVETTKAALDQAQKFYERRQELFRLGAVPNRDVVTSQTDLAQAKTAYDVATRSLDLLQQQSAGKDIKMAQSRLDQARARAELIQAQLAFTEIHSPFAGSVTEQFMYPGDMAKPDSPMFTIMDLSTAVARSQVPEGDAAGVRVGERCAFTSADDAAKRWEGNISVLNQAVDPARRTVEAWCEIPNPKGELRAGVFGFVLILTGVQAKSVVVPQAAVQFSEGGSKASVIVMTDKQTSLTRAVEAGPSYEGKVQIRKGVEPGELVIVYGGYGLADGTALKLASAGASGQVEKK
jgi:HlyD family secretion protein